MTDEAESQQRKQASDDFALVRANAINAYASLEMNLGSLFDALLGAESQKAYVVVASVMNSQARLRMISRLLTLSHGDVYETFFSSLSEKLSGLDSTRNKVAHWIVLNSFTGGKPFNSTKDVALHGHPNLFSKEVLYRHDLIDFHNRTEFYSNVVFMFATFICHPAALDLPRDPTKRTWREILSEKVSYPPAEDHPLPPLKKAE
jgi:hypothetical protein